MPANPMGLISNPLTNPQVQDLTQARALIKQKFHRVSDFGYALPSHVPASLLSIFATFLSVLNFYPPAGMTRDEHGGARTEPLCGRRQPAPKAVRPAIPWQELSLPARLYIASCHFIRSHRRKDRAVAGAAEVCGLARPINRSAICLNWFQIKSFQ